MTSSIICLGIESTAHTFSVGIMNERGDILGLSSDTFTPPTGGLKPADVVEHHYALFDAILKKALKEADLHFSDLTLIAFSQGPGLGPCLRVGAAVARTLAQVLKIPLVGVNHCIAHIEIGRKMCQCEDPITLYVSGGNTIVSAFESQRYQVFGETIDIAAGNLLDMVAREIGIPHPGGPLIEKMAKEGKNFIDLPYVVKGMDLSFSGIFSFVRTLISNLATTPDPQAIADILYSLQETVFSMLGEVTERAIAHTHKKSVLLTGGVAANSRLQNLIQGICDQHNIQFHVVPRKVAGDNGAMIAWTGIEQYRTAGNTSLHASKINPRWRMNDVEIPWRTSQLVPEDKEQMKHQISQDFSIVAPLENYFTVRSDFQQLQRIGLNNRDIKILELGAEAILFVTKWMERPMVVKYRLNKSYRIEAIDNRMRFQRTISEARILMALKELNIPVPLVYDVFPDQALIFMEYIDGIRLKDAMHSLKLSEVLTYSQLLGKYIAQMHNASIAHGDLTTSNILLTDSGQFYLIDFGLSRNDVGIEEQAMDLHLYNRVLQSSHGKYSERMYSSFLSGYLDEYKGDIKGVLDRVDGIELRGRYIAKDLR